MPNEEEILDEIFGSQKKWKEKYPILWCALCEVVCVKCPACGNTSCNVEGCHECMKDYPDWKETKHCLESYLTPEECKTLEKTSFLKTLIMECLSAGFKEIDWQYLHKSGTLCSRVYTLFDELKDFDPESWDK